MTFENAIPDKPNVENEIIQLLGEGNWKAIELISKYYGQALNKAILDIVESERIAEDVLQDVMVKIWKNARKYKVKKESLYTWLVSISKKCSFDYLIKSTSENLNNSISKRSTDQKNSLVSQLQPDNNNGIGLRKLILRLDEKSRMLIYLAYFKGYSPREIEEHMNIPTGSVAPKLQEAMNGLLEIFEEDESKGIL